MKREYIGIGLVVCLVLLLSGCDLVGSWFFNGDIYFWSQFEEGETSAEVVLPYRDTYTVKMTRGDHDDVGYASQIEAQNQWTSTSFGVTLDGVTISGGVKTVEELRHGWHLLQEFRLTGLERGTTHVVVGTVTIDGTSSSSTLTVHIR
jgi:hypothetical protein